MKLEHFLTPYTKINSKLIKYLNIRPETLKLLEENTLQHKSQQAPLFVEFSRQEYRNYKTPRGKHRQNTLWHKSQQDPLWPTFRVMEIKAKRNKWDLIKLKSFCTMKETISKVKRQPSEWAKIIANEPTNKELISKLYKQLMHLYTRKKIWPNQKMGQRTKQIFLQRRHTDG